MATARRSFLRLESLEARAVPAVIAAVADLDLDGAVDDLRITGDAGNNTIVIADSGTGTLLVSIDGNGDGDTTDPGEATLKPFTLDANSGVIAVNLGGGADRFEYTLTGNLTGGKRSITVNLGAGRDELALATGAADITGASRFDLDVVGGTGKDTVELDLHRVLASIVGVRADLGLGNDTCNLDFNNIDDLAAVDVAVELGGGNNVFSAELEGVGKFDQADARFDVVGGAGIDQVSLALHDDIGDGQVRSSLILNADLRGGDDNFLAALDFGNFRVDDHSVASINVRGGAGDDKIGATGDLFAGSIRLDPDSLLDLNFQGGLGSDELFVHLQNSDGFWLEGAMRIRLDGGAGSDTLNCHLGNDANSVGRYDVALLGRGGNDTVTFGLNNPGTVTFGPLGKVLLDGGAGTDSLGTTAEAVCSITGFETDLA